MRAGSATFCTKAAKGYVGMLMLLMVRVVGEMTRAWPDGAVSVGGGVPPPAEEAGTAGVPVAAAADGVTALVAGCDEPRAPAAASVPIVIGAADSAVLPA